MLGLIDGLVTLGDALHLGTKSKKVGEFCRKNTIKIKEKLGYGQKEETLQEEVVDPEENNTD